jgi:hypothetical protein
LAKGSIWEFVDWAFVDPPAFDAPPEPFDDGLAPQAAASRTKLAVAMMAAAVRFLAGRGRRSAWTRHCPGEVLFAGAALRAGAAPQAIAPAGAARTMGIRFMPAVLRLAT